MPFFAPNQENKQKMPRNGTCFFRAKAGLRVTLVIFPSDVFKLQRANKLLVLLQVLQSSSRQIKIAEW